MACTEYFAVFAAVVSNTNSPLVKSLLKTGPRSATMARRSGNPWRCWRNTTGSGRPASRPGRAAVVRPCDTPPIRRGSHDGLHGPLRENRARKTATQQPNTKTGNHKFEPNAINATPFGRYLFKKKK